MDTALVAESWECGFVIMNNQNIVYLLNYTKIGWISKYKLTKFDIMIVFNYKLVYDIN